MTNLAFSFGGNTFDFVSTAANPSVTLNFGRPAGFYNEISAAPYRAMSVSTVVNSTTTELTIDPHGTPSTTHPETTVFDHGPPELDTSGESTGGRTALPTDVAGRNTRRVGR